MELSVNDKLLTPKEVADFLRISTHQVNRLCRVGKLSRIKLGPKTIRIREKDLIAYLEQAADAGAKEHRNGNKERQWHLPSELHIFGSENGEEETISPYPWHEE